MPLTRGRWHLSSSWQEPETVATIPLRSDQRKWDDAFGNFVLCVVSPCWGHFEDSSPQDNLGILCQAYSQIRGEVRHWRTESFESAFSIVLTITTSKPRESNSLASSLPIPDEPFLQKRSVLPKPHIRTRRNYKARYYRFL